MKNECICKKKFEERINLLEKDMNFKYRAIYHCLKAALYNLNHHNEVQVRLWLYNAFDYINFKEEK